MPGPYRAAAGKPPAFRKRPRRGQDPSLRTAPSTSARTPPQVRAATTSTGSHPRRERRPRRPGNLLSPLIPGKTPGPGMPAPRRATAGKPPAVRKRPRRGQDPSLRTDPSTSARTPPQVRAATRQRAVNHVGGGVPRRPGNLPSPPIPGKTSGPGMPGPYRAAVGKPYAVRKRPRRGQDPSLRTDPSASARPYRAYVNYIRRAGCPHPAASSRGSPSTGSHPRRGRRPRRPGNLPSPPIPGKTSGPGMPGPYRAAVGKPYAVRKRQRRGQDPRTAPSTSACTPPRGGAGTATKKPRRSLFPGLPRFFI